MTVNKTNRPVLLLILITLTIVTSCKKTTYTYPASPMTNYFIPLQVGKYATYRLDSLNFFYYGQLDTLTSYLAKDSVEGMTTDNEGRTSWIVVRYLSDTMQKTGWAPTLTYLVTPTSRNTIEVVEDNLRVIRLAFPMDEGFTWTGNTYLPYNPYQDFFDFSDVANINPATWNFVYQNVNKPFNLGNQSYDSTSTVVQVSDSTNIPILDPFSFATKTYWSETYAKHIGLIYRHTELYEYQPPTPNGTQVGYKIGFEITLTMIDHN